MKPLTTLILYRGGYSKRHVNGNMKYLDDEIWILDDVEIDYLNKIILECIDMAS
jgi:hypothetical protein